MMADLALGRLGRACNGVCRVLGGVVQPCAGGLVHSVPEQQCQR